MYFVLDVNFEVNCFCRKVYPNENMPGALNTSMFIPALENLADDELKKKWLQKAYNYEIIGTYAQTEMGHGITLNYASYLLIRCIATSFVKVYRSWFNSQPSKMTNIQEL